MLAQSGIIHAVMLWPSGFSKKVQVSFGLNLKKKKIS